MNPWLCGFFVFANFLWFQACYGWCTTHFGIGMRIILQCLLNFRFSCFMYVCIIHVILLLTPFYVAFWMVVNHIHVCYHKQITHTSLNVNCFYLDFDASWCLWYITRRHDILHKRKPKRQFGTWDLIYGLFFNFFLFCKRCTINSSFLLL